VNKYLQNEEKDGEQRQNCIGEREKVDGERVLFVSVWLAGWLDEHARKEESDSSHFVPSSS
jgi:hypothetical protein